jgi:hypothetical protein
METLFRAKRRAKTMAKLCVFGLYLTVFGIVPLYGQIVTEAKIRKAVFDTAVYYSKIVREPFGKGMGNSHFAITKFNLGIGIDRRSPYCSTFGIFCWNANAVKFAGVNGMAYSWKQKNRLIWHRGYLAIDQELWPKIKLMDAVVCTWSHVEFVGDVNYTEFRIRTVAGNTRGGQKRGEGVYYPIDRGWNYIFGIYDHFTPYYNANPAGVSEAFLKKTKK